MTTWIDTHCHFEADDDAAALLAEAKAAGVMALAVGGNAALNATAKASGAPFAQGYDWSCEVTPPTIAPHPRLVAIGELGFDFHWRGSETADRQRESFEAQARLAERLGLPIIDGPTFIQAPSGIFPGLDGQPVPLGIFFVYLGVVFSMLTAIIYTIKGSLAIRRARQHPEEEDFDFLNPEIDDSDEPSAEAAPARHAGVE